LSIAAHGHADCLSVALAYDGLWYIVDPGTYCYHRDPEWRDHFRGTAAHNTVTIDGSDQSEMLGPFMWGRKARASATAAGVGAHFELFEGRHDGYTKAAGVLHSRTVVFGSAGYWVVVDRLEGAGAHDVRCTFQFAPGFGLPSGDDLALSCDRFAVDMWSATPDGVSRSVVLGGESPPCGWVSEGFGQKERAPAVLFGGRCNLPAELMFVIVPEGRHRGLKVECSPSAGSACAAVEIGHEGGLDRLLLGPGDTRHGRLEGRFGLVAERAWGRELLGMDVAYWTDAGAEVDFLHVPNLIG
jgi:hypothetical protein